MRVLVLVSLVAMVFGVLAMPADEDLADDEDGSLQGIGSTLSPRLHHSRHLADKSGFAVNGNHKPIFEDCWNYHPSTKEEQPVGTYVMTVRAVDHDPLDDGGTITYRLISTSGERESFKVDQDTGIITTAAVFDHDEPPREKELHITVCATDNGYPQLVDICTIKIRIEDINDNKPVFDEVTYVNSVPQDSSVGRVMRISANDIDEGENSIVRYQLEINSLDQQYFSIDKDNGFIFLNKTIDKPPGYKFHLGIIVTDNGEPPLQNSMTLDIVVGEPNQKPPIFTEVPKEPITLKENFFDFNKPIAILKARSFIDDKQKLSFQLVTGQTEKTNNQHTFVLEQEGNTAYLKLGNYLNYEKITDYTLTVRVRDNYLLAAETIINIKVEDVNDNIPIFSKCRIGTVLGSEPVGTPVMQVRAIDADGTSANNQITYELADSSAPFAIDPVTGNITTLEKFDKEMGSFYNIKVLATDNAESALTPGRNNTGAAVFKITILGPFEPRHLHC